MNGIMVVGGADIISSCTRLLNAIEEKFRELNDSANDFFPEEDFIFFGHSSFLIMEQFIHPCKDEEGLVKEAIKGSLEQNNVVVSFPELKDRFITLKVLEEQSPLFRVLFYLALKSLIVGMQYCRVNRHHKSLEELKGLRDKYIVEITTTLTVLACQIVNDLLELISKDEQSEGEGDDSLLFILIKGEQGFAGQYADGDGDSDGEKSKYRKLFWNNFYIKRYDLFEHISDGLIEGYIFIDFLIENFLNRGMI